MYIYIYCKESDQIVCWTQGTRRQDTGYEEREIVSGTKKLNNKEMHTIAKQMKDVGFPMIRAKLTDTEEKKLSSSGQLPKDVLEMVEEEIL